MFKKILSVLLIGILLSGGMAFGATRNVVARADGEGQIGTSAKNWDAAYIETMNSDNMVITTPDNANTVSLAVTNNDTTNNPTTMQITNATTGAGVFIDQNADGIAFAIDSEATGATVFQVEGANTSGQVAKILSAGAGVGLLIDQNGAGVALSIEGTVNGGWLVSDAQPYFLVQADGSQTNVAADGADYTVTWVTETLDIGANFTGNTFTAPVTGKYLMCVSVLLNNAAWGDCTSIEIKIKASNREIINLQGATGYLGDANTTLVMSHIMDMDAADTCIIEIRQTDGTAQTDIGTNSRWTGMLLM